MASDSRTDDAATRSVRWAVGQLLSALSRAVFGVCAVAVGALTLLLAAGTNTGESASVFAILGIAAMLVGFVTIRRLPEPTDKPTDTELSVETDRSTTDQSTETDESR
jgi:membrane protein implicated in regulation of membrane protease activity